MLIRQIFQNGKLRAEVIAPGLFRFQRNSGETTETATVNLNTDNVMWQETGKNSASSEPPGSVTIGLSRPFHIFQTREIANHKENSFEPEEWEEPFAELETLETRVARLFREGREFLKQKAVIFAPDPGTQKKFQNFVSGLESRARKNPYTLKPGDCIALLYKQGDEKIINLLRVLKLENSESEKLYSYEGVIITMASDGSRRFSYVPSSGSRRSLNSSDHMVSLHPDELRQFYFPDSRGPSESVEYYERTMTEHNRSHDEGMNGALSNILKEKKLFFPGDVAI